MNKALKISTFPERQTVCSSGLFSAPWEVPPGSSDEWSKFLDPNTAKEYWWHQSGRRRLRLAAVCKPFKPMTDNPILKGGRWPAEMRFYGLCLQIQSERLLAIWYMYWLDISHGMLGMSRFLFQEECGIDTYSFDAALKPTQPSVPTSLPWVIESMDSWILAVIVRNCAANSCLEVLLGMRPFDAWRRCPHVPNEFGRHK